MLIDHMGRVVDDVHGGRDINHGKRWLVVNQPFVAVFAMRSDILGLGCGDPGTALRVWE